MEASDNKKKGAEDPEILPEDDAAEESGDAIAAEVIEDEGSMTPDVEGIVAELEEDDDAVSTSTDLVRYDPLERYLAEIRHFQPLSKEEEHSLAVAYRERGDQAAGYKLVMSNLRLVVLIAREYQRTVKSLLDLVQEGNIGLLEAVKQYDPYRGIRFPSYAVYWIRAYMLRYIINNLRLVKIGTTQAQRKLFFNLNKEKEKLAAEGFAPEAKLLAERLNVKESEVIEMEQRLSLPDLSVDAPLRATEGAADMHSILADDALDIEEAVANEQVAQKLRQAVDELKTTMDEKEKAIVEQRLFCEEPVSLQVIADQFGLSRERIRQIEARLKAKLKKRITKLLDLNEEGEVVIDVTEEKTPRQKNKGLARVWLISLLVVGSVIGYFLYQGYGLYRFVFEEEAPKIEIVKAPKAVGQEPTKVVLKISDAIAGLDEVIIRSESRHASKDLVHNRYWFDNKHEDTVSLELTGKDPDNKEGRIVLTVKVFDRAFWSNKAEERFEFPIDLLKPKVEPVTTQHNGNVGGSQLAIYRANDVNLSESGVAIGGKLYRGYDLKAFEPEFQNLSELHLIFYPLPLDLPPGEDIELYARDIGGNVARAKFYNKARIVRRPSRYSDISAPQLETMTSKLWPSCETLVTAELGDRYEKRISEIYPTAEERFGFINKDCREATKEALRKLARASVAKRYFDFQWQRPVSTVLMSFGEERQWRLEGTELISYTNEGVEFSASGRGDILSTNSGMVVFSGELGVLGQTVVLDHGFGLVSVYGYLSERLVKEGAPVRIGEVLGRVYAANALALTPRVHIEFYASAEPVNPAEWWDATWRRDHIEEKLAGVKRQFLGIVSSGDDAGAQKLAPSE